MTAFPAVAPAQRLAALEPPKGRVHVVLDTDTDNEIDDQWAVAYALLSPDRIEVEAIYAAPYHNERSSGPEDGMWKSHAEVLRLVALLGRSAEDFVHPGSTRWLEEAAAPVESPAAADLVRRARAAGDGPLYVVALGAITNVASALLAAPDIVERIVVVWLGGNPISWHRATEFNVFQDMVAARVLFDCGVPLVHLPCRNVTEHLRTTEAEVQRFLAGRSPLGDYLCEQFSAVYDDHFARSWVLWDIGPVAWLVRPEWVETRLVHTPVLTTEQTWSHDPHRDLMREALAVDRDAIFGDVFTKFAAAGRPAV